ncbi:hypothetical protein GCM10022209_47410 [Chitinophaga oryziterrae]
MRFKTIQGEIMICYKGCDSLLVTFSIIDITNNPLKVNVKINENSWYRNTIGEANTLNIRLDIHTSATMITVFL